MNKRLTLILFLLTSSFIGVCQVTITGIVLDKDDNLEIPGVSIVEKGTENATISDMDGKFSIRCSLPRKKDSLKLAAFIKFYKLDSYTELSVGFGLNVGYRLKRQRVNAP